MSAVSHGGSSTGGAVPSYRSGVQLTFGPGLDRQSGILLSPPGGQRDLRNVHLYAGKAQLRKGLEPVLASLATPTAEPITHVLAIQAVQGEGSAILVGYALGNRTVHLFRTAGDGTSPEHLYEWFTNGAAAGERPPIVHSCETYDKAFFAHDEPIVSARAATIFYDMEEGAVFPIEADWAEGVGGDKTVKFRGVCAYLAYLVGWGFDSNFSERPDYVRVSMPNLVDIETPEVKVAFRESDFFIIGHRDPVLRCIPAARGLLALKRARSALIVGSYFKDFGSIDVDLRFGIAGSRLAVEINGDVYLWTMEGPGVSDGGPIQPIDIPLDLLAPDPLDLVERGELALGFGAYLPKRREILFTFEQRGYVLHLINPGDPRWSYRPWGVPLYSAGILYGGLETLTGAPTGHPEFTSVAPSDTSATLTWANVGQFGDETVEIWQKATGGAWARVKSVRVGLLASQTVSLTTTPGTAYEVALRYRRGADYTVGYEGADPDLWTAPTAAASKGTFTTSILAPTELTASWSRFDADTEQMHLEWTNRYADRPVVITGTAGTVNLPAGTTSYTYEWTEASDAHVIGETLHGYQVSHAATVDQLAPQSIALNAWAGVTPAPEFVVLEAVAGGGYRVTWTGHPSEPDPVTTEIWDDRTGTLEFRTIQSPQPYESPLALAAAGTLIEVMLRFRHTHTAYGAGIFDYSDSITAHVTLIA